MALQVWLPLNGSLKNQGFADVTITNNGATIDDNGKIGKCYSFNGNSYIGTDYKFTNGTADFSMACWIYLTENANMTYQHICSSKGTNAATAGIAMCYNKSQQKFLWGTADGSNSGEVWTADTFSTTDIYNKWHHIIMVRDSNDPKHGYFYFDGVRKELVGTAPILNITTNANTMKIGACGSLYSTYYWTGKLNDFRIYNHALSPLEAKKLSQGLVLHYRLSNQGLGRPNLVINSTDLSKWENINGSATLQSDGYYKVLYNSGGWWGSRQQIVLTEGVTYTVSGWGYGDKAQLWFYRDASNSKGGNINSTSSPQFLTCTYTPTVGGSYYIVCYCSSSTTNYYKNIHVEIGEEATQWAPANSEDNLGIEYDCSGFGNNGEYNTSHTISTDTPRYTLSTYFGEHQTPKLTLSNPLSLLPGLTNCTITWWGKYDTTCTLLLTGQTTSYYVAASDNNTFYHQSIGSNTKTLYRDGVAGSSYKCEAGTWHHYALVGADLHTWTQLYFNNYSSGWRLKGLISDFRIYATTLSSEDIKALYNLGGSLDNNGVFHTYELQEA